MIFLPVFLACLVTQDDQSFKEKEWVRVEPPGVGAVVEMPTVPRFVEQTLKPLRDQDAILVRSRSSVVNDGKTNFTFVYHDEPEFTNQRDKKNAILDGAMAGAIALVGGELVDQQDTFIDQNKGRTFVYKCEIEDVKLQTVHRLKIRSQIVLVGRRLFSLNYISMEEGYDGETAQRFFDSFELVNAPTDLPPSPRPGRARELAEQR